MSNNKRGLGVWLLTALVVGNMIGSGIFLLPASLAAYGSISLFSWGFTAFGALLLALVFAKLSHLMPKTGGPYAYCREAYGDFVGFEVAYSYWIALWVGNAGISVAFVGYLSVFFPVLSQDRWLLFFTAAGTVWLLTFINILGVRRAGILQLITVVLKVLPLLLLGLIGWFYVQPENFTAFNVSEESNFSALRGAAALTLWAFIGLEAATVPAGSATNPKRDIPRATILGTLIVAIIYVASSAAVMGVLPVSVLAESNAPYADAAKIMFGSWGGKLIALGAMVSCFGALNGWIMLQAQVPMAAAKDKLFPEAFGKISRWQTPIVGLLVSAVLITAVLLLTLNENLVKQFTFTILLATLATLIPYLLTSMGELIIFVKNRERFNGKRFTGSSVIAVLAFLYSYWAIMGAGQEVVYYGCLLLFSGVPIYVWMKWRAT